ncbi:MAG: Ribonuclease protein component [Hyphomicrobiales bacterium]|nr:Ribonuclease protein component [Hyphomicrobiales bacterium]
MNGHDTDRRQETAAATPASAPSPVDEASRPTGAAHFARLKKRPEFLAAAKGVRVHDAAFTLQAVRIQAIRTMSAPDPRDPGDDAQEAPSVPRFGLTVTKKTGNSVVRNRIRRRLREALRLSPVSRAPLPDGVSQDVVVVARREALTRPFAELSQDLARSMKRLDGRLMKDRAASSSSGSGSRSRSPTNGRANSDQTHIPVSREASRNDKRPGPTS